MIGVVGMPKRAITFSIQYPVALLIQPRCCPQSEQMRVAQRGALQHVERTAELQREACGHRSVTGVSVALAARLMVLEEDFSDTAVRER
jgi:hypothetical protein